MENILFFQQLTSTLWGNYGFQALFYFSLILIFILEKERIRQAGAFWYPVCVLLVIYNPATYLLCNYIFGPSELIAYYCRLFCLIPIVFVIAYAIVLILQKVSGWKKLCCTLLMMFIIAASGHSAYAEEWFVKASNFNKVPTDVIQLCEFFRGQGDRIPIMVPTGLAVYMRQMDSRFSMPYGRNTEISSHLESETPDVELVLAYAKKTETDYIVSRYNEEAVKQYEAWGCRVLAYTDNYVILLCCAADLSGAQYIMQQNYPSWVLTQYADESGSQAMFYTMENTIDHTLIVIDGGTVGNEGQARRIIRDYVKRDDVLEFDGGFL